MEDLDLIEIAKNKHKQHLRSRSSVQDQTDSRTQSQQLQTENINTSNVKVDVINTTWVVITNPSQTIKEKVDLQKTTTQPNPYGMFQAQRPTANKADITLSKGVIKGLNNKVKIPLDRDVLCELPKEFGSKLTIYLSKTTSEVIKNEMTLGAAVATPLDESASGVTAYVHDTKKTLVAKFVAQAELRGSISATSGATFQMDVNQAIKDLKRAQDPSVAQLPSTDPFEISGEVEFSWNHEHQLELQHH